MGGCCSSPAMRARSRGFPGPKKGPTRCRPTDRLDTAHAGSSAVLRRRGTACEVYLNPGDKLGKQMAYADRLGIPFAVILGPDEVANGTVTIKSLKEPPPNQQTLGREEEIGYVMRDA